MTASAVPNASLARLVFVRRTAGMSRPDLAERSGVSVATILASERSGRVPHLTTARLLARALNLDVDELFPDTEDHDGHCQADHTRTGAARREGRGFGTSTGHSTSSCKAQRTATSSRRLGLNHGPELACAAMADWAGERTGLHFIPSGQPWRNGYVESFNSRVRDECLNINMFWSLAQARVVISDCKEDYNHRRRHSALGYQAPAVYAAARTHQ